MKKLLFALICSLFTTLAIAQQPSWTNPGPSSGTAYPVGATPVVGSATGSTGAVAAGLSGLVGQTTYVCGFSYQGSNATAAQNGTVTLTGLIKANMNFAYPTLAAGTTVPQPFPLTVTFWQCIPAFSQNIGITATGPALGSGAPTATINIWGYQF